MDKLLPIGIYVRVSRVGGRDGDSFRSPEDQIRRATKYATDNGFLVGPVYQDLDQSGGTHPLERPSMKQALQEIAAGRLGGLVAYDSSRLSREPSHLEFLAEEMRRHKAVLLWSGMPTDPHSPIGELQIGLLANIDRYQRKQAGERFRQAKEAAIRRGIPAGHVPFGFVQLEDRTLAPDPETAPLVREVFRRRIEGHGWAKIATWLALETERPWSKRGISHLIANDLYRTARLSNGGIVSDVTSGEPIVSDADWYAAQSPVVVWDGRGRDAKYLLAGLLRCATCSRILIYSKGRQGRVFRYRCAGQDCPTKITVHGPKAERLVEEKVFELASAYMEQTPASIDLVPLQEAFEKAERQLEQILTPEMQEASGSSWPGAVRSRRDARDAAASALAEARGLQSHQGASNRPLELRRIWPELEQDQRRVAIQSLLEKVIVHKVPRRAEVPHLEYVVRTPPLFHQLEYSPVDVEWVNRPS
jgi:site-specific DNA recombinase